MHSGCLGQPYHPIIPLYMCIHMKGETSSLCWAACLWQPCNLSMLDEHIYSNWEARSRPGAGYLGQPCSFFIHVHTYI